MTQPRSPDIHSPPVAKELAPARRRSRRKFKVSQKDMTLRLGVETW